MTQQQVAVPQLPEPYAPVGHAHPAYVTNPMTDPADVIVGGAAGAPTRLGVGGSGQVLTVVGGVLTWAAPAAGAPSGPAGGDLIGSYPNPQIAPGAITDADVAAANKDGAAATASLRTLGAGGSQAAAGNHAHAGMITNPMTAPGDLITGGAAGAPGRLGVGTADQVLRVVAGAPAWSVPAATQNLLTNPGLEIWQRGAGPFAGNLTFAADRWQILIGGSDTVSVTRDTANADGGGYCAALAATIAAGSGFHQYVESVGQLAGKTVTFTARVKCSTPNAARLELGDGVSATVGAFHTGDGTYQTLTVTRTLSAAATELRVGVLLRAVGTYTVYADAAVLVVGSAAPAFAPLHPAEGLIRCQRYYQEMGGLLLNEFFLAGHCISATDAWIPVVFGVEMATTPTATVSAPGDFAVFSAGGAVIACTGIAIGALTRRGCRLQATVASGLVAGNATMLKTNNTLAARIRIEANP